MPCMSYCQVVGAHCISSKSCTTDEARNGSRPNTARCRHTPSAQQSAATPWNDCPAHASGAMKAGVPNVLRSSLAGLAGIPFAVLSGLRVVGSVTSADRRLLKLLSVSSVAGVVR